MKATFQRIANFSLVLMAACSFGSSSRAEAVCEADENTGSESITVTSWGIDSIQAGIQISVRMKNGRSCIGKFLRVDHDDPSRYRERFDAFRAAHPRSADLPNVNDTVVIEKIDGSQCTGELLAFDYNCLYIQRTVGITAVRYAYISALHSSMGRIDCERLRSALAAESVPMLSSIVVADDTRDGIPSHIPIADIHRITFDRPDNGRTVAIVAVAVLVVGAVAVIINAIRNFSILGDHPFGSRML